MHEDFGAFVVGGHGEVARGLVMGEMVHTASVSGREGVLVRGWHGLPEMKRRRS